MTTAAGTTVRGGNFGINARNFGTGALTITASGDVTGTIGSGIYAHNLGSGPIAITVAATGTVSERETLLHPSKAVRQLRRP